MKGQFEDRFDERYGERFGESLSKRLVERFGESLRENKTLLIVDDMFRMPKGNESTLLVYFLSTLLYFVFLCRSFVSKYPAVIKIME